LNVIIRSQRKAKHKSCNQKFDEQIKINKLNSKIIKIQVLTPYQFTHISCPKYHHKIITIRLIQKVY